MNDKKMKQLFAAARSESAPAAPAEFADDVLRTIRCEPPSRLQDIFSLSESLNALFPRVALAAAVVILLCAAADWGLTETGLPGITDGATQETSQYLLDAEDL